MSRESGTSAARDGNEANEDIVKLTAYFAERERTDGRFLADAVLDLFGGRQTAASVMLRGIASFGPRNVVRSDESLSLSEDLPIAITAADSPERIAGLVDDVVSMTQRGLVTLERGRITTSDNTSTAESTQLTVFLGRQQRIAGTPAHIAVCESFHRTGFFGATAFLGVDGTFGGQRRRAHFFSRNPDVPVMVVAVGSSEHATAAVAEMRRLSPELLLMVERVRVCKRAGVVLQRPHDLPAHDADGRPVHQKLSVHTSEDARYQGQPIHRALLRRLHESEYASGATVLRGLWGFHDSRGPHGDRLLQLSRHVPVTTVIIDTPQAIARSFEIVDNLTAESGLVTSEMVPAAIFIDRDHRRGGRELARHQY